MGKYFLSVSTRKTKIKSKSHVTQQTAQSKKVILIFRFDWIIFWEREKKDKKEWHWRKEAPSSTDERR